MNIQDIRSPAANWDNQLSTFRTVFGVDHLKTEFAKFLKTIFYQLDENKVFKEMETILSDPMRSDQEIYEELVKSIDRMRKQLPSLFYQLKSLSILQKGIGEQSATLMKDFCNEEFHNYLEVYFKRYLKTIQKTAQLPLNGHIFAASNQPYSGSIKEKIEAGALFSGYPYSTHVPLNDNECSDPDSQPEKTHKPIGEEIPDNSLDLIACLGGLHHVPKEKAVPFVDSLRRKLRPGAVLLLRDHNVTNSELHAIASVVHSFVNATNGVSWAVESQEIRQFNSATFWTQFLEAHGFSQVPSDPLILQDDPTKNAMMAFIKTPQNVAELQIAAKYLKSCVRPREGTYATLIEWGNVRFAKQYAEFVGTRHSYAFDYIGHLKQHWIHFSQYLKAVRQELPLNQILLSDNFAMNLFIFISTLFQCTSSYLGSLPSQGIAYIKHGTDWRNATDLTALERYEAALEKEYSEYIDHTPFYMFPYLSKIKGLWNAIWQSNQNPWLKFTDSIGASFSTLSLVAKAAISAPIRKFYTQDNQYTEPDRVSILIYDPDNQFQTGEKCIGGKSHSIKVVYHTPDNHKLVLVPRYRPFTELCKELADITNVTLLQIGARPRVAVDVLFDKNEPTLPSTRHCKLLYEMDKLQDVKERRYATYLIDAITLPEFEKMVGPHRIEYVHE